MRLIHIPSLELQEFEGDDDYPDYAILSHTWGEEEITFIAFQDTAARQQLRGWQKLESCCRLAASRGFDYIWMDTCCIDKRSSAELSEAINSMFRWYEAASTCFAYLADVKELDCSTKDAIDEFCGSRWFTRG